MVGIVTPGHELGHRPSLVPMGDGRGPTISASHNFLCMLSSKVFLSLVLEAGGGASRHGTGAVGAQGGDFTGLPEVARVAVGAAEPLSTGQVGTPPGKAGTPPGRAAGTISRISIGSGSCPENSTGHR